MSEHQPVNAETDAAYWQRRAEAAELLCATVIEVHAHVQMDTPEDKALHAKAVETFRAALTACAGRPIPPVECDHSGIEHGSLSYTGICPKCRKCKFIGHGPLCADCYGIPRELSHPAGNNPDTTTSALPPAEPDCSCGHPSDDHVFTGGGFCNVCECRGYVIPPADGGTDE